MNYFSLKFAQKNRAAYLALMHVGHRIKVLREEAGMSLPKLADKAGISKGLLHSIETANDEPNPNLATLRKISSALGLTIADLLGMEVLKATREIPDKLDPELKKFINGLRQNGGDYDQAAIDALYMLQEREGAPKTEKRWMILYEGIVANLHRD